MRSLPSLLRSLAQSAVVGGASTERPRTAPPQEGNAVVAGWQEALENLEVERVEAMLRRYQGRPPRIENPFAAFPTRNYWLGKMMKRGG